MYTIKREAKPDASEAAVEGTLLWERRLQHLLRDTGHGDQGPAVRRAEPGYGASDFCFTTCSLACIWNFESRVSIFMEKPIMIFTFKK